MKLNRNLHRFSRRFYVDIYGHINRKTEKISKARLDLIADQHYLGYNGGLYKSMKKLETNNYRGPALYKKWRWAYKLIKSGKRLYWNLKEYRRLHDFKKHYVDVKSYNKHYYQKLLFYKRILYFYRNIKAKQFINLYNKYNKYNNGVDRFWWVIETRLDSILLRSQMLRTMFAARHLITYLHILVNGIKINRLSYNVKIGELIGFRRKHIKNALKLNLMDYLSEGVGLGIGPVYLETDFRLLLTTLIHNPRRKDIKYIHTFGLDYTWIYFLMWKRFTFNI